MWGFLFHFVDFNKYEMRKWPKGNVFLDYEIPLNPEYKIPTTKCPPNTSPPVYTPPKYKIPKSAYKCF